MLYIYNPWIDHRIKNDLKLDVRVYTSHHDMGLSGSGFGFHLRMAFGFMGKP